MANSTIPVEIKFGGVDNVSPILGNINLKLSGISQKLSNTDALAKRLTFATTISALTLVTDKLRQSAIGFNKYLTGSIDSYSNIHDNINRISLLTGEAGKTDFFDNINKKLEKTSTISKHTKSELSDLSFLISRSGEIYKDKKYFNDAFDQSVIFSDAGKNEFSSETAFQFLNSQSNIFQTRKKNISMADQDNLTLFAKDKAGMNLTDMDYFQQQVGAVMGIATNADMAKFFALEGILSRHDLKGEKGGTGARNFIEALIPTIDSNSLSEEAKKKYKDSGIALDFSNKGRNAVLAKVGITRENAFDKDGNFNIGIIGEFVKKLNSYSKKDRIPLIKQLFGKTGLAAALTLTTYHKEYEELLKTISDPKLYKTFAIDQANASRNTLSSKIKESQNAWDNFKISILDAGTGDTLSTLTDKFKDLAFSVQGLSDDSKNMIGILGVGTYGFVETCAKLMPVLVTIKLLKDGIKSLTVLTTVWNFVTSLNPLVWIIGAAALAVGALGFAIYQVSNNYDDFSKNIEETNKKILPKFVTDIIYPDEKQKQFDALYTPEQKQDLYKKNMMQSQFGNSVVPTQENLADLINKKKKDKHEQSLADIFNNYNQNKNSALDINVKVDAPQGTKVIQKSKNIPPANLKLGLMGGSLQ